MSLVTGQFSFVILCFSVITSPYIQEVSPMTSKGSKIVLAGVLAVVVQAFFFSRVELPGVEPSNVTPTGLAAISDTNLRQATGSPQLVSIRELPNMGEGCTWEPVGVSSTMMIPETRDDYGLFAGWRDRSAYASSFQDAQTSDVTRPPVRMIRDLDPIYSSVAVDPVRDEVILQDNNLWATRIFNR